MKNNWQLQELIEEFKTFRKAVLTYKKLLLESRDDMADIVMNHEEIADKRSNLMKTYAKLEKFIKLFGQNPRMNDGVWAHVYPAYENAFSADILQRVGPSIEAVLQDLDYIIGRLENYSQKEFNNAVDPKPVKEKKKDTQTSIVDHHGQNHWQYSNPFWLIWQLFLFIWKHKLVSIIIVITGLLAIDYSLAWKNLQWVISVIKGNFR